MWWTIVQKELKEHITSFRFLALFVLTVLLMMVSVLVFTVDYERAVETYPRRVEQWVGEDGKTYLNGVACRTGGMVRQFPLSLAFCSGVTERVFPNQVSMAVHGLRGIYRSSGTGTIFASAAHVDWGFVITVLLSFAGGLLTYKGISGEIRDGTMTQLLSNPLSRATVLLGKYLAALLVLTAALVIAMLCGLIVVQSMGTVNLSSDDWVKLGIFTLAGVAYLSLFILLGLCCSVFARRPLTSAVTFLFIWTCLVFVIPNLGGMLTQQIGHTSTPLQMKTAADAIPDRYPLHAGLSSEESAAIQLQRQYARERLLIEYAQALGQQVHFGQNLTRISPASTFSYATEHLISGGAARLTHFINNAVRFREGFLQAMIEADKEDPDSEHLYIPTSCGQNNFSKRTVDLGPAREFRDVPPSSLEGFQAALLDLSLLLLYNAVLFIAAFLGFSRQDVAPRFGE